MNEKVKLYRSRIYNDLDANNKYNHQFDDDYNLKQFEGFNSTDSGAPSPSLCVGDNRCSPSYISFLYVANNIQTAIEEISPSLDSIISVAEINPVKNLRIADFTSYCSAAYEKTLLNEWIQSFIRCIETSFSKPVSCDKRNEYVICQYISELIKKIGFDGICYSSSKASASLSEKINYAIFNPKNCEVKSSRLFKINDVKIDYYPSEYK